MAEEDAEIEAPTLAIPLELYRKLLAYVEACDNEISGFFEVNYNGEKNEFEVSKVYDLLKQEVGSGEVEIDEEEVGKFNDKLIKEGATQLPRGWWHSHNDMSAFLSTTDTDTIEKLKNNSYIVAIVLNKAKEIHAVVQLFQPIKLTIKMKVVTNYADEKLLAKAEKEVKDKIREVKVIVPEVNSKSQGDSYGSWTTNKRNKDKKRKVSPQYGYDARKAKTLRAFPEDREEARDMIIGLSLDRRYDAQLRCMVYTDEDGGTEYCDYEDLFTYEQYQSILKEEAKEVSNDATPLQ